MVLSFLPLDWFLYENRIIFPQDLIYYTIVALAISDILEIAAMFALLIRLYINSY